MISEGKYKTYHGQGIKILMLQRLLIALAQVKAGNRCGSLLTKILQIIYSLYQQKKLFKNYITI